MPIYKHGLQDHLKFEKITFEISLNLYLCMAYPVLSARIAMLQRVLPSPSGVICVLMCLNLSVAKGVYLISNGLRTQVYTGFITDSLSAGSDMKYLLILVLFFNMGGSFAGEARYVETPYQEPKVVYDFFFDKPEKINAALFWIRSLVIPLSEDPYNYAPEFMDIKVIIHGFEIVTVAKENYPRYKEAVERMKYYAQLGVEFRVCSLAARDFNYKKNDFYDFIKLVPSAIPEIVHWQQQGYGLVVPQIHDKKLQSDEDLLKK